MKKAVDGSAIQTMTYAQCFLLPRAFHRLNPATTMHTTDTSGTHGANGQKRSQDHSLSRRKNRKWLKISTNQKRRFVRIIKSKR